MEELEIDKELGELFKLDSNNQLSALIDKLYTIGEHLCAEEPDIIHRDKFLKCRLLLKKGEKMWLVDIKNDWPIAAKMLNGDIFLRLDLDQCNMRAVQVRRGDV